MALLADAIRASDTQSAVWRSPDGYTVFVKRVTGREGSFDQEEYAVFTQRPGAPTRDRIAALNLIEALVRMRELALPGFDPEGAAWEPTTIPDPEPKVTEEDREDFRTL
jgi:hypothetical protein